MIPNEIRESQRSHLQVRCGSKNRSIQINNHVNLLPADDQRRHNRWTFMLLAALHGPDTRLPPQRYSSGLSMMLVVIYTSSDHTHAFSWFLGQIWSDLCLVDCETRLFFWSAPLCQHRWMFTLSVDLRLFRSKMSTCCPPHLIFTLKFKYNLSAAATTEFLQSGKSKRIYIWDSWKIKPLKIPQRD